MATINPLAIDTTQPPYGAPTTAGLRAVVAAIATELGHALADVLVLESASRVQAAGYHETQEIAADVCGGVYLDPGVFSGQIEIEAILSATDALMPARLELYNLTDGASVAFLTTPNAAPTRVTQALVPGTTAGFPVAPRLYEIRLWVDGGDGIESAILHAAAFVAV